MGRVIIIGESELGVTFAGAEPVASAPGGCLLNVAAAIGGKGVPVAFVSEVGNDRVGEMLTSYLAGCNVDLTGVDRFAGGLTPVELRFDGGAVSRYERYPDGEGLDVAWPRMEKDDVLVFGGYMALSPRVRNRLWQLVTHAKERKITIIYYIGDIASRESRITRVMPTLFENLEIADMVITTPGQNRYVFGNDDAPAVYRNNVSFHCNRMTDIDTVSGRVTDFGTDRQPAACGTDAVEALATVIVRELAGNE